MRAIQLEKFGGPEDLTLEELPAPKPAPGEVLIDVHAIGVNFIDLLVIAGQYQNLPPLPFVPGVEVAGVVAKAGEGVTACKPGDRVMAQLQYGGYAEQAVASGQYCYPLPDLKPGPPRTIKKDQAELLTRQPGHLDKWK